MKLLGLGKIPWDMAIFLSVTVAGFGLSVKKLAYPDRIGESSYSTNVERNLAQLSVEKDFILDLGCLERRAGLVKSLSDNDKIQLRGRFCDSNENLLTNSRNLKIRNLSTGLEGTLFLRSDGFTSEELRLKPGKNILQVEWVEKSSGRLRLVRTEVFEK